MGKLLYVSFGNANTPGRGVTKKINSQLKVFQAAGMETVFLSGYDDRLAVYRKNTENTPDLIKLPGEIRRQLSSWIGAHAAEFDFAYIRFQFFDLLFEHILKNLKKNGVKIVVEIPTYPYIGELKAQGVKGVPKIIIDRMFQKRCGDLIDGFTSPAYEGIILRKQVIPMRNGIDMDSIEARVPIAPDTQSIRLLAVASMSPWHGFERLLQGIAEYYKTGNTKKIILNLVGEGVELERYKELTRTLGLDECVKFWGRLSGAELNHAYDITDIGICSLGIHKLGIEKSNTLKTLEYLAKGMPIVCEVSEAGVPIDCKYRLNVPSDDSPIQIENIIEFYDHIYKNISVTDVISKVRRVCSEQCSTRAAMSEVTKFFLSNV